MSSEKCIVPYKLKKKCLKTAKRISKYLKRDKVVNDYYQNERRKISNKQNVYRYRALADWDKYKPELVKLLGINKEDLIQARAIILALNRIKNNRCINLGGYEIILKHRCQKRDDSDNKNNS